MARFKRLDVLNTMVSNGVVPVFYNNNIETVKHVVQAVYKGGSRIIEFTNRGDFAFEVFGQLEKYCAEKMPDMITGVGSVADPVTAGMYINMGANFVVGPMLNPDVAKVCNRRKIAYSPGCGSASEVSYAEELGCEIIKIFPGGQVGGPSFVKALLGPCPWTSIMPTGGVDVTEKSLTEWFGAGVACVGIGSKLITREMLKNEDWEGIADSVSKVITAIDKIRS